MLGRLRQQGGAMILTVPNAIVTQMGWKVGNELHIAKQGENVILSPVKRPSKGRKTLSQLLEGIDSQEIAVLNAEVSDITNAATVGKEAY